MGRVGWPRTRDRTLSLSLSIVHRVLAPGPCGSLPYGAPLVSGAPQHRGAMTLPRESCCLTPPASRWSRPPRLRRMRLPRQGPPPHCQPSHPVRRRHRRHAFCPPRCLPDQRGPLRLPGGGGGGVRRPWAVLLTARGGHGVPGAASGKCTVREYRATTRYIFHCEISDLAS